MIPSFLLTIAWVIIGFRCGLRFYQLVSKRTKDWLEISFHLSVVLVAISFLL